MRLELPRLHTQANAAHSLDHLLMQPTQRIDIPIQAGPHHLRSTASASVSKSPETADSEFERLYARNPCAKSVNQLRGLVFLNLAEESERYVHRVRRHPAY